MNPETALDWTGQDEVVNEVRATRDRYAARFDYDLRRILENLKAKESQHPERRADLCPLVPTPEVF